MVARGGLLDSSREIVRKHRLELTFNFVCETTLLVTICDTTVKHWFNRKKKKKM